MKGQRKGTKDLGHGHYTPLEDYVQLMYAAMRKRTKEKDFLGGLFS